MADAPPTDRRPIVISGPSGVGKGSLIDKLIDTYPDTFASTVSHTTRPRRANEIEGKAYFFASEPEFLSLVSHDAFIESAPFSGHYYGTSKQTILDQSAKGLLVLLDIDMQGVKALQANSSLEARYVFIKPPTFEALEHRLRNRSTDNEENIQKRLARARVELEDADKSNLYDVSIVNGDLQTAFQELVHYIYGAKGQGQD